MEFLNIIDFNKNLKSLYVLSCQELRTKYKLQQVGLDILLFLGHNEGLCHAKDISNYKDLKPNLISLHVNKLVETGYLIRKRVKNDRREISLILTEKAKKVIEEGNRICKKFYEAIFEDLKENDLNNFFKCIKKIDDNAKKALV